MTLALTAPRLPSALKLQRLTLRMLARRVPLLQRNSTKEQNALLHCVPLGKDYQILVHLRKASR